MQLRLAIFCLVLLQFVLTTQGLCNNSDTIGIRNAHSEITLITGVNAIQFAQRDEMVSPLVYKGNGYGLTLGLQKRKSKTISSLHVNWNTAKLNNTIQAKRYYSGLTHLNSSFGAGYALPQKSNSFKMYLGWQVAQQADFRRNTQLQNASFTYNFSLNASPEFLCEKTTMIEKKDTRKFFKKGYTFRWRYQLAVPLIAGISRPSYNVIHQLSDGIGSRYQTSIQKEVIDHFKVYTLNKFFAIDSKFEIQYLMKNGNAWSIQCAWVLENFNKADYVYKNSYSGVFLCFYSRLN